MCIAPQGIPSPPSLARACISASQRTLADSQSFAHETALSVMGESLHELANASDCLQGSAGQSFASFLVKGMHISLLGDLCSFSIVPADETAPSECGMNLVSACSRAC